MKFMKIFLLIIIALIIFLYVENNVLYVTRLKYTSTRLPQGFDGFRIIHLSDLHCKEFGENNKELLHTVKKAKPDLIVFTGDLIDSRYFDEGKTLNFMDNLNNIAPVYFVTGNHERANRKFADFEKKLRKNGTKVLRNEADRLERNGDVIYLMGVDDPITTSPDEAAYTYSSIYKGITKALEKINYQTFKILLTHRPETFSLYVNHKIDLIFAGHAHGGQIRIPFIGGLAAPGQGLFPRYSSRKYKQGISTMVVSRGLGNSSFPQRIFNRPEVVVITMQSPR